MKNAWKNATILVALFSLCLYGVNYLLHKQNPNTPGADAVPDDPVKSTISPAKEVAVAQTNRPLVNAIALTGDSIMANSPAPKGVFGNEIPFTVSDLPDSPLRRELEALPPKTRDFSLKRLAKISFHVADLGSLHVDRSGMPYFVCAFSNTMETGRETVLPPPARSDAEIPLQDTSTGNIEPAAVPGVQAAPVPIASPPIRHSKPGATRVLFLDFNGHVIVNTAWNNDPDYGYTSRWDCLPFDTDSDPTTFSDTEQQYIIQMWERVAEDYAPFDVDVTTEQPTAWTSTTGHALITPTTDANGTHCPHYSYGGVAYVNVFGDSNYSYNSAGCKSPAWVTPMSGDSYASTAEAAAHELGHNMGLSHDGKTDGTTYYKGHGSGDISWGPIMGLGYGRHVSQWSKGEYYQANQTQDDLDKISQKTPYRTDDHGNINATATALTFSNQVISNASGIILNTSDVDVFSFSSGAGTLTITVFPYRCSSGTYGGNLDVLARLYNSNGTMIQSNNSATATHAVISYTVTVADVYYLHVSGTGTGDPYSSTPSGYTEYGSIGQYTLTGFVPTSLPSVTLSLGGSSIAEAAGSCIVTANLSMVATQAVTVGLSFSGTATLTTDYTRSATSIVIAAGNLTGTVTLTAVQDTLDETNETVMVDITSVVNATENGTQQVTATILDDDFTVTFNAQGGTVNPTNTTVATGLSYGTLPVPARTGYTFSAWWTGTNGTGLLTTSTTPVTAVSNHTLYAKWIYSVPFIEGFENGGVIPGEWTQAYLTGSTPWTFQSGGGWGHNNPASAYGGSYNALLCSSGAKTKLVTPLIDLGATAQSAQLTFWHCMQDWTGDQDELRVYYKTATNGSWTLLAIYTTSVASWTQQTVALPNPSQTYFIAFEGYAKYGEGICIDDVYITASASIADTDGDAIPDSWEQQYFNGVTNATADADGDADGLNNLYEYITGTNPTNKQSVFGVSLPRPVTGGVVIRWAPSISGRVYGVHWTTNLMTGFQPLETNILWPQDSFTNPTAIPCGYYKIKVKMAK